VRASRRAGRVAGGLLIVIGLSGCRDATTAGPDQARHSRHWQYQLPSALATHAAPRPWLEGDGLAAAQSAEGQDMSRDDVSAERLNAVANGLFEAGLRGWTVVNQAGGSGSWFVQLGARAPFSGLPQPAPNDPPQALSDQLGAGSHILYQDVAVPSHGGRLTFDLSVDNWAGFYFTPHTLDFTVVPNQQFRADIVDPADPVETARILRRIFLTTWGMPSVFTTRVVFDMTPFAGQTVRLRFAEVDNQSFLNVGIDNVRVR
jgi:hypothetical protein